MWWQVLGVAPDADLTTIKRAYSALIKQYRPESHPEQFSQIRAAFEQAKKQAVRSPEPFTPSDQLQADQLQVNPVATAETDPTTSDIEPPPIEIRYSIEYTPFIAPEKTAIPIIQQPPTIEENPPLLRQEQPIIELLEAWKKGKFKDHTLIDKVLSHPDTLEFYALKTATTQVLCWLMDNVKHATLLSPTPINMPVKALARLDRLFGWSSCERELYLQYHPVDLSLILYGIAAGNGNYKPLTNWLTQHKQQMAHTYPTNSPIFLKIVGLTVGLVMVYAGLLGLIGIIILITPIIERASIFLQRFLVVPLLYSVLVFLWALLFLVKRNKRNILTRLNFYTLHWVHVITTITAILLLECLVGILWYAWYALAAFYWVEMDGFIGLLAIPLLFFSYWLNKELLIFVRR